MKIKSFECPKSIRNYEKKILATSDTWSTSRLSHQPSEPAYYIVDCRIFTCLLYRVGRVYEFFSFPLILGIVLFGMQDLSF